METATDLPPLDVRGRGLLPVFLALHLLRRDAEQAVTLRVSDPRVGGDVPEPVRLAQLGPAARSLVEDCCVARWNGHVEVRGGRITRHAGEVWLLDPVQAAFELDAYGPRCTVVVGESEGPGAAPAGNGVIDLTGLTGPAGTCTIVGRAGVDDLALPILADYDAGGPDGPAVQTIPLGDGRVLLRTLPPGDSLVSATSGFESLLSALVAP